MITSKSTSLFDLSPERRREIIAEEVRANATTPYSGTDGNPCSPLFDHQGIKDNMRLQQEITRIAAEYVDMLLLQDDARARRPDTAPIHAQIRRELVTWSTHAFDSLLSLLKSHEISTDPNLRKITDKEQERSARDMLAATIKLSLVTKFKMNEKRYVQGNVPSAFGLESVAYYREASIEAYGPCLSDENDLNKYAEIELDYIEVAVSQRSLK
jgi:hypothetical protein